MKVFFRDISCSLLMMSSPVVQSTNRKHLIFSIIVVICERNKYILLQQPILEFYVLYFKILFRVLYKKGRMLLRVKALCGKLTVILNTQDMNMPLCFQIFCLWSLSYYFTRYYALGKKNIHQHLWISFCFNRLVLLKEER